MSCIFCGLVFRRIELTDTIVVVVVLTYGAPVALQVKVQACNASIPFFGTHPFFAFVSLLYPFLCEIDVSRPKFDEKTSPEKQTHPPPPPRPLSPRSKPLPKVMKDLDLESRGKLLLAPGCKSRLMAELTADAEFLSQQGIMDYSLLVRGLAALFLVHQNTQITCFMPKCER